MFSNSFGVTHLQGSAIDKSNARPIPHAADQVAVKRKGIRFFQLDEALITGTPGKIAIEMFDNISPIEGFEIPKAAHMKQDNNRPLAQPLID